MGTKHHSYASDFARGSGGFTLIELSIVLVIIALVVAGILTGKDLIEQYKIRTQISQIEKFQIAANAFRGKYNWLPGDLTTKAAATFGFESRNGAYGRGDGNGILQCDAGYPTDNYQTGELLMFWNDLAASNLIQDPITVNAIAPNACPQAGTYPTQAEAAKCYPLCKIYGTAGASGGAACLVRIYTTPATGQSYFFLASPVGSMQFSAWPAAGVTPTQAFGIDAKIDDGMPFAGKITLTQPGNGSTAAADTPAANACANTATSYNLNPAYANQVICIPSIRAGF